MGLGMQAERELHVGDKKGEQGHHERSTFWKAGEAGGGKFKKRKRQVLASEHLPEGWHEMGAWDEDPASDKVLLIY